MEETILSILVIIMVTAALCLMSVYDYMKRKKGVEYKFIIICIAILLAVSFVVVTGKEVMKKRKLYVGAYREAMAYEEQQDYISALDHYKYLYDELGDYKDVIEKVKIIQENIYQQGCECQENENYQKAISCFLEISDYKDSKTRLMDCVNNLPWEEY